MRLITTLVLATVSLSPGPGIAQEDGQLTAWQAEKCRIYRDSWEKALDFFGTNDMNYNFIAQNENFMASGCTAPISVCAQSNQERDIANALTLAMMNAGAASTFLPFRCGGNVSPMPVAAGVAPDSELCWAQLDVLKSGGKLIGDEAEVFEAQCACLERNEQGAAETECTS